jgi:hypothetical protein
MVELIRWQFVKARGVAADGVSVEVEEGEHGIGQWE